MHLSVMAKIVSIGLLAAVAAICFLSAGQSLVVPPVEAQRSGAAVYSQNCARCHGADGRAQTTKGRQVKAVDLTSDDWTPDDGHDTRMINRGKGSMPGFKGRLSDNEISAVVEYIRRFKR